MGLFAVVVTQERCTLPLFGKRVCGVAVLNCPDRASVRAVRGGRACYICRHNNDNTASDTLRPSEHGAMAKARLQEFRQDDPLGLHLEDPKHEEAEETLDESGDSMEDDGQHMSSSDEEIEETVAEDILRFEQSFEGINKRYRLINRVGEGKLRSLYLLMFWTDIDVSSQAHSPLSTRLKIWNTTNTRTAGIWMSKKEIYGRLQFHIGEGPTAPAMLLSRRSTSPAVPCAFSTSSNCCMTSRAPTRSAL